MTSRIIGINHSTAEQPAMLPAAQASQAWHPLNADAKKAGTSAKPQSASLPKGYSVQRCDYDWAGRGEDNLLEHHRIMRDGWRCLEDGDRGPYSNSEFAWNFLKPEIFGKASPSGALELRRILKAIYQKNGRWYVEDFEVRTMKGAPLRSLPECSWAGWQTNGDLLFAIGGCLYRLTNDQAAVASAGVLDGAKLVADLTDLRFAQMLAPDWALTWP